MTSPSRAASKTPGVGSPPGVASVAASASDLEHRVQLYAKQVRSIYVLTDAVIRASGVEDIYDKAIYAIQLAHDVDRASLLLLDSDGVMRFKAWRGLSDDYRAAVEGNSPWSHDERDPKPVVVADVEAEPGYEELGPLNLTEGIRALAFVPLLDQGRLLGTFMLYYNEPHTFDDDEMLLSQTIANHIAFSIERMRTEDALRAAEERYRGIFENAVFGAFQTTPAGQFIAANEALARILGYESRQELVEKVTDIAHQIHVDPERRAEFARILEREGAVHNFEAQAFRKDGSIIWLSLGGRVLRDSSGGLVGYEGIVEDVTARKMAEEAREESERRLQLERERVENTVSNVPGVVWEAYGKPDDRRQRIDFVSEYVEQMLGYEVEEWLSTPNFWLQIVHPEDRQRAAAEAAAIFAGKKEPISEFRWVAKDGRTIWVQAQSSVIRDVSGEAIGMRGVTMDITERKREEERQAFLSEASAILSSSLEYEETLDNVARLVVGEIGDLCSIDLVEDGLIKRVALAHIDPRKEKLFSAMNRVHRPDADDAQHPVLRVTKSQRSELVNDLSEATLEAAARDEAHLNALRDLGVQSAMIVPLAAGPRTLGALTIVSAESGRRYNQLDLALAEELAGRAAAAIERARLFRDTESARQAAEQAAGRTARLQEITAALSESLTPSQVGETVMSNALAAMNARSGIIVLLTSEDGLELIAMKGESKEFVEMWKGFAAQLPQPILAAIRGGQPFFAQTKGELIDAFPGLAGLPIVPDRSFACIPLMVEGHATGAMVLTFESPHAFTGGDRDFIIAFASQCAQALERARLYEAEQEARGGAEAAQQRLWFLAEANAVLSSSLDFETTLTRVSALAVPWLADCCVAHVFPADGMEPRSAVSHIEPAKEALVRELHARYVPSPGEPHPLIQMIETQASVLVADIDEERLGTIAKDEAHRKLLVKLGFKSYMAVPLIARGRLFGALTLARTNQERLFGKEDLVMAEELARRAALALDNARLYEEAQNIQEALRVALEAKDEFLGVMSHELRTPITAIYGGTRVLRSRAERLDDESKARLLEDIEQESERLFRMVENLLVLSRLELGQEVATEPVLAQRLVGKLASNFQQRRPARPLKVVAEEIMDPVAAEPHYLEQVLRNLLTNADKYSPPESPIEIAIRQRDNEADICVLDRGSGIAAEETEMIFERFYRSDRTAAQAAGIGLGLTVCKRLIEAQAGTIWARPRKGGGLEVGVTLPLYKEAP